MTPLVLFTLAWVGGILLAQADFFPLVWLLLLLPASLVLLMGWGDDFRARRIAGMMIGVMLGAARMLVAMPHITPDQVSFYNGAGQVELVGIVSAPPDERAHYVNVRLSAERLTLPNGQMVWVRGKVLVKAPVYPPVAYGDRVLAVGQLETPPQFGEFSYRDCLARQGVYALLRQAQGSYRVSNAQCAHIEVLGQHQASRFWETLYRFRAHAQTVLAAILPEPQSSLLTGILLGVESGIPDDLNAAFAATGTSHIVAISGFNLSIIAGVFALLARRLFGKRGEAPIAAAGVWLYTFLVGASAAVVRAAAMASVALLARHAQRRVHGPTSLAAAVWLMSVANPYVLWDVGFQLSLAATLGLLLYVDPLTDLVRRQLLRFTQPERAERILGWLSDALIVTTAAQITTTPIIVATFRRLSLVTLLTNFLILPVQAYVMLWGGLALLGGLITLPLGQILGWLAWVFLSYTIAVVQWTASFPWASVRLGWMTLPLVWGYYLALAGGTAYWLADPEERAAWSARLHSLSQWQVATVFSLLVLFGAYFYAAPDGKLHVSFLDVGQGDAIFIRTPRGRQLLVDGGPEAATTLSRLGHEMPFWDRTLDGVILTAPDGGHVGGLTDVLQRYQVDWVGIGSTGSESESYQRWAEQLLQRSPDSVGMLAAGDEWPLDADVHLRVLWPPAEQTGPLVLQLIYGDTSFLLAGSATPLLEKQLVQRYGDDLRSDVLLLPRHGAKSTAMPAFLQAVNPNVVIISTGPEDRYHTPAPATLSQLQGYLVYRTDQQGTITVTSDGQATQVRP